MRRPRTGFATDLGMGLTAAATSWAALLSWGGFTELDIAYLLPLVVGGAAVALTGAVTRWARWPAALVLLSQLVVAGAAFSLLVTGSPLPVAGAWTELTGDLQAAVDSARAYAAPVPEQAPGLHPLLIGGGLLVMVLVDLVACTARRVPLAGLPLLTVYSLPISILDGGVPIWVFVLTAAGFLALLFLFENDQINRWGRAVPGPAGQERTSVPGSGDGAGFGVRTGAARSTAGAIGTAATALAVVVPLAVPTLSLSVFDFGQGPGGDSEVNIENPTADLLRDLNRGEDVPLLRVTTDDPSPDHLRISALTRFGSDEWTPGDRDIPDRNRPDGSMPPLQGVSADVRRTEHDYDVEIFEDFRSAWLPTQAPISAIRAEGDWRYDEQTMDFFRWDEDLDTRNMQYSMTAVELDLEATDLADASLSTFEVADEFLELPKGLPGVVRSEAFRVTGGADTRFEKAVLLQDWFREEFTYDLEDSPVKNTGFDALEQFLEPGADGRKGYCEQFAAAMASMARVLGIPSRVAIGFLQPDRVGNGTWEYSAHDLHAWPELYFDGYGWVMFEPTPPSRAPQVPTYTSEQLPNAGPSTGPSARASEGIDRGSSDDSQPSTAATPEDESGGGGDTSAFPWGRLLLGLAALALVVLGALAPRALRERARGRRLAGGPEAVWAELAATVADLRQVWPSGRSPRETRDRLVTLLGRPGADELAERPAHGPAVNPAAVAALDRIVDELERLRYARHHAVRDGALAEDATTCLDALTAGVPPRVRRRARWWPASVLSPRRRSARSTRGETSSEPARWGGVVEHMG